MKPGELTLDQHLVTACELRTVMHTLSETFMRITHTYPQKHKIHNEIMKCFGYNGEKFLTLLSELDDEFYEVADREQIKELGSIYYRAPHCCR